MRYFFYSKVIYFNIFSYTFMYGISLFVDIFSLDLSEIHRKCNSEMICVVYCADSAALFMRYTVGCGSGSRF